MSDLYDALRESHKIQRRLAKKMADGRRKPEDRKQAFLDLAVELDAHAAAEERFLYAPMLMDDEGLSVSRHALAEHHELEEMVAKLRGVKPGSARFDKLADALSHEVHHHLKEEEKGFFQLSGRILTDKEKERLAGRYRKDYERMLKKLGADAESSGE